MEQSGRNQSQPVATCGKTDGHENGSQRRKSLPWAATAGRRVRMVRRVEGYLFLGVVMDICSRTIVGWSMRDDLKAELVVDALAMAVTRRRPPAGLVHHSDRGRQPEFKGSQESVRAGFQPLGTCWEVDAAIRSGNDFTVDYRWQGTEDLN